MIWVGAGIGGVTTGGGIVGLVVRGGRRRYDRSGSLRPERVWRRSAMVFVQGYGS